MMLSAARALILRDLRLLWRRRGDALQPAQRFAQWPGRQQPAVAEAAGAVDHDDFHVACQAIVLQAVVGDQHVATSVQQQLRRRRTIAPHRHRHAAGADQAGFVADLRRVRRFAEPQRFTIRG